MVRKTAIKGGQLGCDSDELIQRKKRAQRAARSKQLGKRDFSKETQDKKSLEEGF